MATDTTELAAGIELDASVAQEVMGWRFRWKYGGWINPKYTVLEPPDSEKGELAPNPLPRSAVVRYYLTPAYSTDIAAAWQVIAHFQSKGLYITLHCPPPAQGGDECEAAIWRDYWSSENADWVGHANTLPLAICRAALLVANAQVIRGFP